jgi:hypothetical protein
MYIGRGGDRMFRAGAASSAASTTANEAHPRISAERTSTRRGCAPTRSAKPKAAERDVRAAPATGGERRHATWLSRQSTQAWERRLRADRIRWRARACPRLRALPRSMRRSAAVPRAGQCLTHPYAIVYSVPCACTQPPTVQAGEAPLSGRVPCTRMRRRARARRAPTAHRHAVRVAIAQRELATR